ncbi:MAG: EFR1 family ferrodoxin [Eubacteriaceae bacterium]|nr:EFR1 family ferrodoxin [Eubacteriaceae bacterium]
MAIIYCFTATGNSLYAAKQIAEKIEGSIAPMNGAPVLIDDDVIGFVFPVYFWGLPRIVERFVAEAQISNQNAYVFAVATYGGVVNGTLGLFKNLLKSNSMSLNYGEYVKSVENYIPRYKVNSSEELRQKADKKILEIAEAVSQRKNNRIQPPTIINRLVYRSFPDADNDQFFTIDSKCTGCAICQKVCPVDNITMGTGKPEFHRGCEHCMACLHSCPEQAIDWKEKTQGKERYRNANIELKELISFSTGRKLEKS